MREPTHGEALLARALRSAYRKRANLEDDLREAEKRLAEVRDEIAHNTDEIADYRQMLNAELFDPDTGLQHPEKPASR
jgi:predicted  nucleic acid-binding Zn-ribbon protein